MFEILFGIDLDGGVGLHEGGAHGRFDTAPHPRFSWVVCHALRSQV
jgi:hypothetical protein